MLKTQSTVGIRFDEEHHDRYHRLLAHLYTFESRSVENWMLENGYALVIAIPPNLWNLECYQQAEQRAQTQGKGLWSQQYHYVMDAATLNNVTQGFHIVKGRVNNVGETERSLWLNLEGGLALRIDRGDLAYFNGISIMKLKNHEVLVRGWVHYDDDLPVMRLRHSVSLQVIK